MSTEREERLMDLLAKRTFDGLTEAEERELAELNASDDISLDLTAAAIALADMDEVEPMPANLRSRIESGADEYFANKKAGSAVVQTAPETETTRAGIWTWLGWAVAAAACIALAANMYLTRVNPTQIAGPGPSPTPSPAQLTPEQQRQRFMASAPDIARADIGPGKESYKPTGEIVWSDAEQSGYIKISGLPKNDPNKEQYQLWIFDENQDPKTPVDGGVFNVNSDREVVIPIDAKIKVRGPKVFAITVEKPGGVVVSKQEKVAALAKVETNPA
jgi:anti-sigma-K factor RskA